MYTDLTFSKLSSLTALAMLAVASLFLCQLPPACAWAGDWDVTSSESVASGSENHILRAAICASGVRSINDTANAADIRGSTSSARVLEPPAGCSKANCTTRQTTDDGEIHNSFDATCPATRSCRETADAAAYFCALGWVSLKHHRYKEAEASFTRALQLRVRASGSNNWFMLEPLLPLAVALDGEGKYEQAESLYKRALPMLQKAVIRSSIEHDTGLILKHVAEDLIQLEILPMALDRREKEENPDRPAIATRLSIRVLLQAATASCLEQNHRLATKALAIIEEDQDVSPTDVAACQINLARSYGTAPNNAYISPLQQESLYKLAISRVEQQTPASDQALIQPLLALAIFYCDQGSLAKAQSVCKRAIAIAEREGSPAGGELIDAVDVLTAVYRRQDRLKDARAMSDRALKLAERAAGPTRVEFGMCLLRRAMLEAAARDFRAAERYCEQSESIIEKELGRGHSEAAWVMRVHSRILENQLAHPAWLVSANTFLSGCLPLHWLREPARNELVRVADLTSLSGVAAETYRMIPPAIEKTTEIALAIGMNMGRALALAGMCVLLTAIIPFMKRKRLTRFCIWAGVLMTSIGLGFGACASWEMQSLPGLQADHFYFQ